MTPQAKRILILIVGWGFILLGIVGLILPFLQGILFILVGLIILSSQYAWARLLLSRLRRRFPKIGGLVDTASVRAKRWMRRLASRENSD
jgi:uncharacterized protein